MAHELAMQIAERLKQDEVIDEVAATIMHKGRRARYYDIGVDEQLVVIPGWQPGVPLSAYLWLAVPGE